MTPPASQPPAAPPGTVPDVSFPPPSEPVPDPAKVVSVVQETGIYAGPNSEARRTDTVRPGERLRLLDARDGWVRVASPQDRWGWVPGELVQVVDGPLRIQVAESGWSVEKPAAQQPAGRQPGAAEIVAGDAVVGPRGATLHLIPATAARVLAELSPGEPLEVLDRDGQWVKVRLSSGQVGWTRGALLEQPPAPPADGAPDDGEREGVDAGGAADEGAAGPGEEDRGFAVRMRQGAPGVYVLEVTAPGRSLGAPRLEGRTLRVPFSTGLDGERAMPLNQMGVARAVLTRDGLTLTLTGEPRVAVESALDGTLLVTLRPVVTEIRREGVGDNGVLRFTVRGTVQPRARAEAGQIIVEFPGAVLGTAQAPAGVQAVETATGVRVALPSAKPFALKPWEGGYDLVTYPSGLAGKVILLDPGHGGDDGGAVSRATGVVEKAVNLQVALRLRALLAEKGATVYMTRADDRRAAPDEFLRSVDGEPWDQLDLQYRTHAGQPPGGGPVPVHPPQLGRDALAGHRGVLHQLDAERRAVPGAGLPGAAGAGSRPGHPGPRRLRRHVLRHPQHPGAGRPGGAGVHQQPRRGAPHRRPGLPGGRCAGHRAGAGAVLCRTIAYCRALQR
ncbi:MAG: hypothetical protein A6D92_03460 [Symbiobacterium thermophilum]|uniref:SH3b domain-containing protein n=1 Tax=Symbiobacterium thermophilum TaxID=2734 RepID=A0A1Y2T7Z2_SYMTR|nr:MAG: hypothetical protein A6D92_03460 [Symbiobacterium thermophilum]